MEGEPSTGGEREPTSSEGNRPENSRDAQGQAPTPETPEHMLLSTVGESGESTPEDWQTSYQNTWRILPSAREHLLPDGAAPVRRRTR